jgi:hypothetical protein
MAEAGKHDLKIITWCRINPLKQLAGAPVVGLL